MSSDLRTAAINSADELRDAYRERRRSGDGTRCENCGTEPASPDVTVAAFPQPWLEFEPFEILCHECWAREAAGQTVLGEEQAQVVAVRSLGFTLPEMASAIGGYEDDVEELLAEINDLEREIEDEMDDVMRTAQLFDAL